MPSRSLCGPAAQILEHLRGAQRMLLFTGAGISTNSGIPDFRGPKGVWRRRDPVYFEDFLRSGPRRLEYWDQKLEAWPSVAAARPTATHLAIKDLQAAGRVAGVVTQNIDGLHEAAGSPRETIHELHGTGRWIRCLDCGEQQAPDPVYAECATSRTPPRCATCGGFLKPATISFGQSLDPEVLRKANDVAQSADLVIAMGSTLSVHPAAGVPLAAAKRGVPYVVINRGATDHDVHASLRMDADVDAVFVPAVRALLSGA